MKKILFTIAILAAFAPLAAAQGAMPFLRIDRNPATAAMGGAQVTSSLYNPAAVPFNGSDVAFSFQSWAPSGAKATQFNLLGGVSLGEKLGITVLAAYQMGESYTTLDQSGNIGAEFRPSDLVAGIGAGYAITDNLSAGVNLKMARTSVASNASYNAFAADVYVMYVTGGLKVSGGVSSLGTKVTSGSKSYALPASATVGAGYDLAFGSSAVKLAADFDYFFSGGLGLALGGQYGWNDMVFARAGYHLGTGKAPVPSYLSLGAGAKFANVHVDLCWLTASPALGNTLAIGVGYCF